MCDQFKSKPGTKERLAELDERMRDNILRVGHQVNAIFPREEDEGVSFAYTVGRNIFDHADLLITGNLHPQAAMAILNDLAAQENEEKIDLNAFADSGDPVRVENFGSELRFKWVDAYGAAMFGATNLFDDPSEVKAIQVIWPDDEGRWPDDPEFAYGPGSQPVFALTEGK